MDVVGSALGFATRPQARWGLRRRVYALGLVALLTSGLLASRPVLAGDTFMVGPQGTPMSLEEAVSLAKDGDTIELVTFVGGG